MRLYRAALHLLPRSFRDDYGPELEATFARRLGATRNALGALALVARELVGLLAAAGRAHGELLRQDLRGSLRSFARAPGFAVTAIVVAALGIGATTTAFSVTDHVLLRRLPFADPDRLVKLWMDQSYRGYPRLEPSPAVFRDWRERSRSFESMAAYWQATATLVGDGAPARLEAAQVSASLAEVLRIRPAIGRLFTAADDRDGAPRTVVLGHAFWRSRFGADRGVVGRTLILDGAATEVIGVLPAGLLFPTRDTQVWMPQRFAPSWYEDRDNTFLRVIGRLRPEASLAAARAELAGIADQLAREFPDPRGKPGIRVLQLRDELSRESRLLLMALLGASLCLLLLSCTNLASLLLARALARAKELAIRAALGGGRVRLARQMLTESALLALIGGLVGVALAYAATPAVARLVPTGLPIAETPEVDVRLLIFATALTVATGIGFGLAPALRAPLDASAEELREGSRAGVGGRSQRWRRVLVGAEVTLTVALLVSAGLLLRALFRLQAIDPGFQTAQVLTLRTSLPRPEYEKTEKRHAFYTQVLDRVRALPGVTSAGYISFLPMTMRGGIWGLKLPGQGEEAGSSSLRFVTPGVFAALGIPLRAGRDVSDRDTFDAEKVAVVSDSFVRRFFPDQPPIGRHFEIAFFDRTIVGVVGDVAVRGLGKESEPQVYLPSRQVPDGGLLPYDPKDLAVRTTGPFAPLATALRGIVAKADPNLPITDVRPLATIVADDTAPRAAQLRVLGAFALVALLLAGVGLHGLLAYAVNSRRQEIGVRMAMGASSRAIVALVLGQGLLPAASGVALGLMFAAAAGRAMSALLAGVSPFDAQTYLVASAIVLAMTLLGAATPALRALRLNPIAALRAE